VEKSERAELNRWVCRLADGDRSAFHPVFTRCYPALLGFANRLLEGHTEAEDAAQEALLKVFSRASEFDGSRDALSWMFALTAYECRTARQRRARRGEESGIPEGRTDETPEAAYALRELLVAAQGVLGALPAEDAALLEAAWSGGARPTIAAATFRKRVQRLLERLRVAWRIKHGAE
jgi:RNA polymerase sigma-70 factor, ECF subfamily